MIRTTLEEAKSRLGELFDAALRGEEVFITDESGDERVVRLTVVTDDMPGPEFGSGRGLFRMADNFDDLLPNFDERAVDRHCRCTVTCDV